MKAEIWPPWQVTSLRTNLSELAGLVSQLQREGREPEQLAWLARLLVVRASGYVEQSVHEITRAFVQERSGGYVRSFAHSWTERTQNPSPDSLSALLGRFDALLQTEFEEFLDANDQRYRRELAFMVDRRNKIAHGLNEGIRASRSVVLVDVANEVVDWLILKLNPYRERTRQTV